MSGSYRVIARSQWTTIGSPATLIPSLTRQTTISNNQVISRFSHPQKEAFSTCASPPRKASSTYPWSSSSRKFVLFSSLRSSTLPDRPSRTRQFHSSTSFFKWITTTTKRKGPKIDPDRQLLTASLELARASADFEATITGTLFDDRGAVVVAGQEFKKTDLITEYGLQSRDLRKIGSSPSYLGVPYIFVRPSTILVNLPPLRVLIQADRLLVIDPQGHSELNIHGVFVNSLKEVTNPESVRWKGSTLPYELHALESVLLSVTSALEVRMEQVQTPVKKVLQELKNGAVVDEYILRQLLDHSTQLSAFQQQAELVRDAIRQILDADDDMSAMYLSDRKQGKIHAVEDHQEVELLLELYENQIDRIFQICSRLEGDIIKTERTLTAVLDAHRNQIMILDVRMTINTLGLAAGTLVAGLYGMNLVNYMEDATWGFAAITSVALVISLITTMRGRRRLMNIQKQRRLDGIEVEK